MMKALGFWVLFISVTLAAEDSLPVRQLEISKGKFVVRGIPTFLLGISYFDGMSASPSTLESDLSFLKRRGFNAIRVWATWYGSSFRLIHRDGTLNREAWNRLKRLLDVARQKKFIVDLTFSRGGVHPISVEDYRRGIRAAAIALKPYPFVFLDIQNETNLCERPRDEPCAKHLTLHEVAFVRSDVKKVSERMLVTASRNGQGILKGTDDYKTIRSVGMVDFIATHRPKRTEDGGWAQKTDDEVGLVRRAVGASVPVLFDEPNRCEQKLNCETASASEHFLTAARNAKRAGAAGWFFHTAAAYDLRGRSLVSQLNSVERDAVDRLGQTLSR